MATANLESLAIELHLFSDGNAQILPASQINAWIESGLVAEFFAAEGNHAEVWVGGIRPLDEVATSTDQLADIIARSLGSEEPAKQYHVIRHADGCSPEYCGTCDSMTEARTLAESMPSGLPKHMWATSRIAPIHGLVAPELDDDAEAIEWHGADGTWGIFRS